MSTNLKGRLEIRLSPEDRDAVLNAAKSEGVNKSEWCRRVFASVLGTPKVETGPREAKDGLAASRLARPSIPSEAPASQGSEGVRPAVQSQTPSRLARPRTSLPCMSCGEPRDRAPREGCMGPEGHAAPTMKRADAEAKPERITQPVEPQISRSAQRMQAVTGRPAPHLPKCVCAMCKPPKTGKGKK